LIFGTRYTERTPILAVFAGGSADKCSDVPKPLTAASSYAVSPPFYQFPIISNIWNTGFYGNVTNPNLTYLIQSLRAFYDQWPQQVYGTRGNPFPWVNKNAKLDIATKAVMEMYKDNYAGNQSVTLTVAGTLFVVPSKHSSINEEKIYDYPSDFQSYLDLRELDPIPIGEEFASSGWNTVYSYRQLFNEYKDGPYDRAKSSDTFKKNVIGSSEQINDPDGLEDGVIVPRVFDYANGVSGDVAFQSLSGLENISPLIFNVLVGTNIVEKDNGDYFVAEKAHSSLSPIGTLNC
jgi:hypothetical protein